MTNLTTTPIISVRLLNNKRKATELDDETTRNSGGARSGADDGADETNDRQPRSRKDLDQDPDFRKWKSQSDRQIAQAQRMAQEAREEAQRMREERERERMQLMDESERAAYQNEKLREENENLKNQQQLAYQAMARQREMARIVAETGIPMEDIEEMTAEEAWVAGIRYLRQRGGDTESARRAQEESQSENDEPEERPRRRDRPVDLGSGSRPTSRENWQRDYNRLKDAGDTVGLISFLRNNPEPK